MKGWNCFAASLLFCAVIFGQLGCSKEPAPPEALAIEKVPAELNKAFRGATPEIIELVGKVTDAVEKKDYSDAYLGIQALGSLPNQTSQQRALDVRAMLSIHNELQNAGTQGDEKATAALNYYQSTK